MRFFKRNPPQRRQRAFPRALRVEILHQRVVLDGAGLGVSDPLPWFDPAALTYSFAPDGTQVAGQESQLFKQLSKLGESTQWQRQFDLAFQSWLSPLNASITQVADSGSRFGVAGPTQGDLRFGDVRIASIPLSDQVLATSIPRSAMVHGSWAGDILINANVQWNKTEELFSVVLHEFGHVLGLPHSTDPQSVMYVHGVHNVLAPTPADIEALQQLYHGIQFEHEEREHSGESRDPSSDDPHADKTDGKHAAGTTSFPFDPSTAVTLLPSIGSSVRYTAAGKVTDAATPVVYRLDPTAIAAKDLETLTVTLQSRGVGRMIADVAVYDATGAQLESQVLHHGQGSVVVQIEEVERTGEHYLAIYPSLAAPERFRTGDFEVVIDLGPELRSSREVGQIKLGQESPVVDQTFSIGSSRLVHVHLESQGPLDLDTTIHALILDKHGEPVARFAMHPGTSRSAPLTFLDSGSATLRLMAVSATGELPETQWNLFIDEVSIDVGPGIIDPTDSPYLSCEEPQSTGTDTCFQYDPIVVAPPTVPDPTPQPPDPSIPWWWEFGFDCSDYIDPYLADARNDDPLWWEFYIEACQVTAPPPTNLPPTNLPPTNLPPTNLPPTNLPPTNPPPVEISPWQNAQNRFDVSGNSVVSALDALLVINLLGHSNGTSVAVIDEATSVYADVSGDFRVTARDALLVINSLFSHGAETVAAEAYPPSALPAASSSTAAKDTESIPLEAALLF